MVIVCMYKLGMTEFNISDEITLLIMIIYCILIVKFFGYVNESIGLESVWRLCEMCNGDRVKWFHDSSPKHRKFDKRR